MVALSSACVSAPRYDFGATTCALRQQLYIRALTYTRHHQDAQDLVQDTYVQCLEAWSTFRVTPGTDPTATAAAWMSRMLVNLFITSCRSRTRRQEALYANLPEIIALTVAGASSGDLESSGDGHGFTVAMAAADATSEVLARALGDLDEDTRELVINADVLGLTQREIAQTQQCAIGTVKSRLNRAHRRLAEALDRGLSPPARPRVTA